MPSEILYKRKKALKVRYILAQAKVFQRITAAWVKEHVVPRPAKRADRSLMIVPDEKGAEPHTEVYKGSCLQGAIRGRLKSSFLNESFTKKGGLSTTNRPEAYY
ncbi:hypothetical protein [Maribellus sediminis]|uniref:hypothetical protein n=1 Tax=Maribellus sediminis TaxID=2696285 RepID=UPI001430297C|nr:hypothetical protein [Maribellus sediminis]